MNERDKSAESFNPAFLAEAKRWIFVRRTLGKFSILTGALIAAGLADGSSRIIDVQPGIDKWAASLSGSAFALSACLAFFAFGRQMFRSTLTDQIRIDAMDRADLPTTSKRSNLSYWLPFFSVMLPLQAHTLFALLHQGVAGATHVIYLCLVAPAVGPLLWFSYRAQTNRQALKTGLCAAGLSLLLSLRLIWLQF